MELTSKERQHWIEPIVIDTKEDAGRFVQALEQAAAAPKKKVEVNYKEITDIDEIKRIFHKLNEPVECWETLCLENSHCDVYENTNDGKPFCCQKIKDCPNRILLDNF